MTIDISSAAIAAGASFILTKAYDYLKDRRKEKESKDSHRDREIVANTIALTELRIEIKHLTERLAPIPKLMNDVYAAHELIRDIKKDLKLKNSNAPAE